MNSRLCTAPIKWLVILIACFGASAEPVQYDIRVDGMICPFCVATSEKALKKIAGVRWVSASLEEGVVSVCTDESVQFTDKQLKKLFLRNGFTFRGFTQLADCSIENGSELEPRVHDSHKKHD